MKTTKTTEAHKTIDKAQVLLLRSQHLAADISIYSGRDLDELHLYKLEAASLRDDIHEFLKEDQFLKGE